LEVLVCTIKLTNKDKNTKISVMASYRTNRIISLILVVVVVVIVITVIVSITKAIFSSNSSSTSQVDTSQQALLDTGATSSVKMTVRGPIVADENFDSYSISISPATRDLTIYNGYALNVTNNINLNNSTPSYEQFVYALNHANLVKGTPLTGDANDVRGVCATGELYTFDVLTGSQVVKELWTSSCSGSQGSLNADLTQIENLFIAQIPNAQQAIAPTNLN